MDFDARTWCAVALRSIFEEDFVFNGNSVSAEALEELHDGHTGIANQSNGHHFAITVRPVVPEEGIELRVRYL